MYIKTMHYHTDGDFKQKILEFASNKLGLSDPSASLYICVICLTSCFLPGYQQHHCLGRRHTAEGNDPTLRCKAYSLSAHLTSPARALTVSSSHLEAKGLLVSPLTHDLTALRRWGRPHIEAMAMVINEKKVNLSYRP